MGTNSDGQTHAHTPNYHCDNYVLLNTCGFDKKDEMLVTRYFSFSHNVFLEVVKNEDFLVKINFSHWLRLSI